MFAFLLTFIASAICLIGINTFSIDRAKKDFRYADFPNDSAVCPNLSINSADDFILKYYSNVVYEKTCVVTNLISKNIIPTQSGFDLNFTVFGVSPSFLDFPVQTCENLSLLKTTSLLSGENITPFDYKSHAEVCLLYGCDYSFLNKNISEFQNAISLCDHQFLVKGTLKDGNDLKRRNTSTSLSIQVFVPISTFADVFANTSYTVSLISKNMSKDIVALAGLDGQFYGYESIWTITDLEERESNSSSFLRITLVLLLSLLTCVSVSIIFMFEIKERMSEIGIRRACGASSDDICFRFLKELLLVCVYGVLFGVLISVLFSLFASIIVFSQTFVFFTCFDFKSCAIAVSILILSVTFSSLIPSYYASKMNVISIIQEEK